MSERVLSISSRLCAYCSGGWCGRRTWPTSAREANRLEEVEAGLEHDPEEVWTEYRDPDRDPWEALVLPVLKQMPIDRLVKEIGMHRRSLFAIRAGERRPHPRNRQALVAAVGAFANERLRDSVRGPSLNELAAGAAFFVERSR